MLPYQLITLLISVSGLMTIIYLAFLIIFVYHKYPHRKCLIRFIIALIILVFSLFCYSQAGYTIVG